MNSFFGIFFLAIPCVSVPICETVVSSSPETCQSAYEQVQGDDLYSYNDDFLYENDGYDVNDDIIVHSSRQGGEGGLWPNHIVPYSIHWTIDERQRKSIANAIARLSRILPCVSFKRVKQETPYYVQIRNNEKLQICSAEVGFWNKTNQILQLSKFCRPDGAVIHEMIHTLGFYHEHTREDRDQYVIVHEDNIQEGAKAAFETRKGVTYDVPYNYDSIMHYSRYGFAKDPTKPTIEPTNNPSALGDGKNIGQGKVISLGDIRGLNARYQCLDNFDGIEDNQYLCGSDDPEEGDENSTNPPNNEESTQTETSTLPTATASTDSKLTSTTTSQITEMTTVNSTNATTKYPYCKHTTGISFSPC